jgi:hypothetical protein
MFLKFASGTERFKWCRRVLLLVENLTEDEVRSGIISRRRTRIEGFWRVGCLIIRFYPSTHGIEGRFLIVPGSIQVRDANM